jgi:hypothetical protein
MAAGRDWGGPSHSALLKKSLFALRYQLCTSDSCALLTASQPWHESQMAEHAAFPVHASHSAFGGTVARATLDGCELLSQPIKSNRRKSAERIKSLSIASGVTTPVTSAS